MSAGKLVKGIVKRLLNSSNHHQIDDDNHRTEKVPSPLCDLHGESNKDVIRDAEGCWRRQRRNSQRSKQCKKLRSPNEDKKPLALPDVVPKEETSTSCHRCKTQTLDDFCYCGHYYHHRICDDDIDSPTSRPPDPVCVCEDCYLALMNICKHRRQIEYCDRLCHLYSRWSTCIDSSDRGGDAKTELRPNGGPRNSSNEAGNKQSCRLRLQTEKRMISNGWSILSSDSTSWVTTVHSGLPSTRFSESAKSGTSAAGHPTSVTSTPIDLPPSICLTKDGEQSYDSYAKGLASRERLFSYRSSVVPPNRTICHVTAAS